MIGPSGEQLTEVDQTGTWKHTHFYAAGKLMGTFNTAGLHFHLDDPLCSRRAQTNYAGALEAVYQSLPIGDGLSSGGWPTLDWAPSKLRLGGVGPIDLQVRG